MEISKTASRFILALGILFGIGGLVVYRIWPNLVWIYTVLEVLAAVHFIVFFVTHFESFKAVSRQRSTQLGLNSVFMGVLFVAILVIINFIIAQHEVRIDLSAQSAFTLSPQTLSVLKGIKHEVKISGFFQERSNKVGAAKDIFENYRHQSSQVKYELIDPDKKPAVAKQYGVTEYDTVVVESNGQSAMIKEISEQELTSAFIRVSRESKKQLYFIEGHGEHSIDDTDRRGYAFIKTALEGQGFAVSKLVLLSEKAIPEDATLVIIGGPETEYAQEEQTLLRDYLARDGQIFALLDPMTKNNLDGFFAEWGVLLEHELILDPTSGLGPAIPVVGPSGYLSHDITKNFALATFYSLAQSVAFDPQHAEQFRFDSFVQTSARSYATKALTPPISIDPERDRQGPIVIGGVFSKNANKEMEDPDAVAVRKMRLVVMGDSDFAANELVRSVGNGDLFQNVISWLAQEDDLVSIRPKESTMGTLLLAKPQQDMIFYVSVLILPLGILFSGIFISRMRRRL